MDFALFSPSSLFDDNDDDETAKTHESYVERSHQFPGMTSLDLASKEAREGHARAQEACSGALGAAFRESVRSPRVPSVSPRWFFTSVCMCHLQELLIREFSFHELNANLLWPGTFSFAEWLVQQRSWVEGRRTIELGRHVHFHSFFLCHGYKLDVLFVYYDDQEIAENIAHNCRANGISPVLPHVKHSWGDAFPSAVPNWDLVIASDILLYVKQYANLIKTLSFLLKSFKPKASEADSKMISEQNEDKCLGLPYPAFLMSWRRRIGKEDESLFFNGCENAGLEVQHLGSRVYCIKPGATAKGTT
ncbi:hypothetical protein RHSIM_Rhsim05G0214800 [Rhododendron simsii]|uniref:Uncharacterized protein n=1 Tax=Rhododendron simsii TaxID=118357 RepID=A0A834H047_RHOSS|nr:hypothetical protein RHSIM_Rhsim05G0214800 [Rhododendron simsii]